MKLLAFILRYSRWTLIGSIAAGVLSGACTTGLLAVINSAVHHKNRAGWSITYVFSALVIAAPLTRAISDIFLIFLAQDNLFELRTQISRRILKAPLSHLEEIGTNRILAVMTEDLGNIANFISLIPVLSINTTVVITCLAYMGWLSFRLLLIVLLSLSVGVVTYQAAVVHAMRRLLYVRRQHDTVLKLFQALLLGIKELKLHRARRNAFLERELIATAAMLRKQSISGLTIYSAASTWGQFLVLVILGWLTLGVSSFFPVESSVLTGFVLVLFYLISPLQLIMNTVPQVSRANISVSNIDRLGFSLEAAPTEDQVDCRTSSDSWTRLELRGVTYRYRGDGDESFVLGPISLVFRPAEIAFVAGGNGSGKTTFAKVLAGLYAPDSGEVLLDGVPVTDDNRDSYRQHFSAVFSDFYLFESLLGLEGVDLDDRAAEYLGKLHLRDKVKVIQGRFSRTELSQGQRKRLALLTAYLENRPIYLFDEWAADQDPVFKETFYGDILQALKARGSAVIVISHDDRYYRVADRVIRMEAGTVVSDVYQYDDGTASTPAPERRPMAMSAREQATTVSTPPRDEPASGRNYGIAGTAIATLAAVFLLIWWSQTPKLARGDIPASEFSALRAQGVLREILGKEGPHPLGTQAEVAVRERIIQHIRSLGLNPQEQATFTCNGNGVCGQVHNIVTEVPGAQGVQYVMLSAHYDSVGAGPGAADDGAGVAALLEIMRILKAGSRTEAPVLFLLDDGEENGLLGAKAFAEQNPLASRVCCVINLEARGTRGPSLMFETNSGNEQVIALYAHAARHPVTNSFLYDIYRRLPNDTDFSVFKLHGKQGINLAFIGDANNYHSGRDDLTHASLASLQHQGENALAMARAFGHWQAPEPRRSDSVFFDVFNIAIVRWPASWTPALLFTAVFSASYAGWKMKRLNLIGSRRMVRALLGWFFALMTAILTGGMLLLALASAGATGTGWPPHVEAGIAASLAAAALSLATGSMVLRDSKPWELLLALCGIEIFLSSILYWSRSGAVYLSLIPALCCAAMLVIVASTEPKSRLSSFLLIVIPEVVSASIWFPVFRLLYMGVGVPALAVSSIFLALLLLPACVSIIAPHFKFVMWVSAAVFIIGVAVQVLLSPYSPEHPQTVNITFHQDTDRSISRWVIPSRSARRLGPFLRHAGFDPTEVREYPWQNQKVVAAPAPNLALPGPDLRIEKLETHNAQVDATLRIVSMRGAAEVFLFVPPASHITKLSVNSVVLPAEAWRSSNGWSAVSCVGCERGAVVSFSVAQNGPFEVYAADKSFGLPDGGNELVARLPQAAAMGQDGNLTIVTKRFSLQSGKDQRK